MLYIFSIWRTYCFLPLIIEFANCQVYKITKQNCTVTTIGNLKCTNCSSPVIRQQIYIEYLPSDLGTDITCLYTYNLLIEKMDSKMFENYPSLTHLYMIRNGFPDNFTKDTLDSLKRLLYLNFTDSNMFEGTEITWPPTLRILDVTRLPITTLVAPDLHLLEVVNISKTKVTEFPLLSETAPLKEIVLHYVKMTNFKVDTLAKYCKLQRINALNLTLGNNCQCLQMKAWLEKWDIKMTHDLNCKPDSGCTVEFSETSINNREHCLSLQSVNFLFLIIMGIVVILIFAAAGFAYLYEKLMRIEEEEGLADVDLQNPPTKTLNQIEEETADDDQSGGGAEVSI